MVENDDNKIRLVRLQPSALASRLLQIKIEMLHNSKGKRCAESAESAGAVYVL